MPSNISRDSGRSLTPRSIKNACLGLSQRQRIELVEEQKRVKNDKRDSLNFGYPNLGEDNPGINNELAVDGTDVWWKSVETGLVYTKDFISSLNAYMTNPDPEFSVLKFSKSCNIFKEADDCLFLAVKEGVMDPSRELLNTINERRGVRDFDDADRTRVKTSRSKLNKIKSSRKNPNFPKLVRDAISEALGESKFHTSIRGNYKRPHRKTIPLGLVDEKGEMSLLTLCKFDNRKIGSNGEQVLLLETVAINEPEKEYALKVKNLMPCSLSLFGIIKDIQNEKSIGADLFFESKEFNPILYLQSYISVDRKQFIRDLNKLGYTFK